MVYDDEEIEHFVSVHLSKLGINKLVTALRVYENSNGSIPVQVELTSKTNSYYKICEGFLSLCAFTREIDI